jgi:hypothetical protein
MIALFSILTNIAVENDYPVPTKTDAMLFYIQRNHNSNTIIYDANFDSLGGLIKNKPIDVYWLRYQEQGQRMELRTIEKRFAYGVECLQIKEVKDQCEMKLVAFHEREFRLVQKEPFKAITLTMINDKESQLDHVYIYADNSGFWPKVKYIDFFGYDVKTGKPAYERLWHE